MLSIPSQLPSFDNVVRFSSCERLGKLKIAFLVLSVDCHSCYYNLLAFYKINKIAHTR